ncbi:pro-sigmaK processing inhibitor BofA family protein [Acetivibrio clariflavus]|uniref:Pro-sigmaK processing inhibitor BofA n=1 Tax=Acetivibrio clariflavus (strain DSM 19732 / NBRC 101661 / EBR45) TaxID=720554 RepID=G8LYR2_ACECE|nr:pro-sigmaK processing inhibitor BofA family protein [Acetivibrio clariflavus]AEV66780.1 pro-sigmaK processing inhibitor BofA [Acetivibrio clariflavus DSM 19732]
MNIEYSTIFLYIAGIIFLFFLGRIFAGPMKVVARLIGSSILGGIVIFVLNLIGSFFNFCIALNFITSFIVGTLGIPGICLIIALQYILKA